MLTTLVISILLNTLSLLVVGKVSELELIIDGDNGDFKVLLEDDVWFEGEEISVRNYGQLYSTKHQSNDLRLVVRDFHSSTGTDALGDYILKSLLMSSADERTVMRCNFRLYESAVVFEQSFPLPLENTSTGDMDSLVSSFPTFSVPTAGDSRKGYAHWLSWHSVDEDHSEFVSPIYGLWGNFTVENSSWNMAGGISGSGVTSVFSPDREITFVLSPFTSFMSQSHAITRDNVLAYGVMGSVTDVPQFHSQATILYLSRGQSCRGTGLNRAMAEWGRMMRKYYNVLDAKASHKRDVALSHLGYSTDNGAYYYYNTALNGTHNYDQTLTELHKYTEKAGIRYKYVLLDSWWYYRANSSDSTGNNAGSGVKNWVPRPEVFPDGIESLTDKTGWLVQAHNRYWADDNVYATDNGGSYLFGINHTTFGALPLEECFWEDLFEYPAAHWNLRVYEQDWMNRQVDTYYPLLTQTVGLSEQWLHQMASGARSHNITIQYCMPNVRHMLASLEVNSKYQYADSNIVTQTRASNDHKPSMNEDQWRIGGQSMLIHALGLAPSKDGFWSTSVQPNNPYGDDKVEAYPALQSLVATMSTGPVQLGDGIGFADPTLIRRSCRIDGLLLQPDEPMMPIDACIYHATFGLSAGASESGPVGDIWYSFSQLSSTDGDSFHVHYLAVLTLQDKWTLSLEEFHSIILARSNDSNKLPVLADQYWVFDSTSGSMDCSAVLLSSFSPLLLQATDLSSFRSMTIVPVAGGGVSILGEMDKWVSASGSGGRFLQVAFSPESAFASVDMTISVGETVHVGFIIADDSSSNSRGDMGKVLMVSCVAPTGPMETLVRMRVTSNFACLQL
jgi:hypothetical protein